MSNEIYLQHHGILGQKWGVRRYQNPDGTLTEAGRNRYYTNGQLNDKGKKDVIKKLNQNKGKMNASYNSYDQYLTEKEKLSLQEKYNTLHSKMKKDPHVRNDDTYDALDDYYNEAEKAGKRILGKYANVRVGDMTGKSAAYKEYSQQLMNEMSGATKKPSNYKVTKEEKQQQKVNSYKQKYTSDFENYLKKTTGVGYDQYDDPDLVQLMAYEYESSTGKKANKNIVSKDKVDYIEKARQQGARVLTNTETQKQEEIKRRNKIGMYNGNKSNW